MTVSDTCRSQAATSRSQMPHLKRTITTLASRSRKLHRFIERSLLLHEFHRFPSRDPEVLSETTDREVPGPKRRYGERVETFGPRRWNVFGPFFVQWSGCSKCLDALLGVATILYTEERVKTPDDGV